MDINSASSGVIEHNGPAVIGVTFDASCNLPATVDYTVTLGTASAADVGTPLSGTLNFTAANTTASISVPIIDDSIFDDNEDFTVTLSNLSPTPPCCFGDIGPNGTNGHVVTIQDNETSPMVEVLGPIPASFPEGQNTSNVFSVRNLANADCNVDVTTTPGGGATAGTDYTTLVTTLNIPMNQVVSIPAIPIAMDSITPETGESFDIVVTPAATAGDPCTTILLPDTYTVDILDVPPVIVHTVSFDAPQSFSIKEGQSAYQAFSATGGNTSCDIGVATVDISATSPADYTGIPPQTTLTFSANPNLQSVTIPTIADGLAEPPEQFRIILTPGGAGSLPSCLIGSGGTTGEIVDIDDEPVAEFSSSVVTRFEGDNSMFFGIVLTSGQGTDLPGVCEVDITSTDMTATAPADYTSVSIASHTVTSSPSPFPLSIATDNLAESSETFQLAITPAANSSNPCIIGSIGTVTVNITDVPPSPNIVHTVSLVGGTGGNEVVEGENLQLLVAGQVAGAAIANTSCDIGVTTTDITATLPADYTSMTPLTTLTFDANTSADSGTFTVSAVADGLIEAYEAFEVALVPGGTGTLPSCIISSIPNESSYIVGIEDEATVDFSSSVFTVSEGDISGTNVLQVDIVSGNEGLFGSSNSCDVDVTSSDGTAAQPTDYTSISLTSQNLVYLNPLSIPIITATDSFAEPTETFQLTLTPTTGSTNPCVIGPIGTITINITDDPPNAPTVELDPAPNSFVTETNSRTLDIITTSGTGICDVIVSTTDGTATSPADYTPFSQTVTVNGTASVSLATIGDLVTESNETLTVSLSAPTNSSNPACNLGTNSSSIVTIQDLLPHGVEITTISYGEEEGNSSVVQVEVTFSGDIGCDITISTIDGTATSPADYIGQSTVLSFVGPSLTPQTISIPYVADNILETTEFYDVQLSPGPGTTLPSCFIGTNSSVNLAVLDLPAVGFNLSTVTVTEGGTAQLDIITTSGSFGSCDVDVTSSDLSASAPGDYTAVSTTLTITSSPTGPVSIPIAVDSLIEGTETFEVALSPAAGSTNPCVVGYIDVATVSITANAPTFEAEFTSATTSISATEGNNAAIEVALTANSSLGSCDIDVTTLDGTAVASSGDYTPQSTTLTVQPSPSAVFSIPILNDVLVESGETFTVVLSTSASTANPACIVGTNDTATVSIIDLPPPPTVEFTAATLSTGVQENAGSAVLALQISAGVGPASVDVSTVNGTAIGGTDFTASSNTTVTIPAGSTAPVTIPITNDTIPFEGNETFTVTIVPTPGSNTLVGTASTATVTIIDSSAPPTVEFTAASTTVSLNENGISPVLEIVVSAGNTPASVELTTMDGSATAANNDYTAVTQTLVFNGATTSQTVTIPINTDTEVEPDESLTVVLTATSGSGTLIGNNNTATITIVDTTTPPTVEFAAASTTVTADEDGADATLTLVLSAGAAPASVELTTVNGSAVAPGDFVATTQTVVFPSGSTTQTVSIPILGDGELEAAESFTAVITPTAGTPTVLGNNAISTITITDTTPAPTVEFDANSIAVTTNENETNVSLTLNLTNGSAPASVVVVTTDESAIAGQDYTGVNETVIFPAGSTTQTITIPVISDPIIENDESFLVNLSPASGTTTQIGAMGQSTVTITDTSLTAASVEMAVNTVDVNENAGEIVIELQRTGNAPITVSVNTVDGSAVAGTDYTTLSTPVSWQANEQGSKFVNIDINNDSVVDPGESFSVQLSQPMGGNLGEVQSTQINIVDDSLVGLLLFSSAPPMTNETSGTVTVQVERLGGSDGSVSVNYSTEDGSASAGSDFVASNGTLTWQAGDSGTRDITIELLNDNELENSEEFFIQLSGAAPLGDAQQLGQPDRLAVTISDDSAEAGQLQFAEAASDNVPESTSMLTVLVERINGLEGNVLVDYATRQGSASEGTDYQAQSGRLSWDAGDAEPKVITVSLINDTEAEGDETFFIDLTQALPIGESQIGSPATHVITIADDEMVPAPESPFRVATVNENTRTHVEGQIASGLDFEVTDVRNGNNLAELIEVRWRVEPANAVVFLEGEMREDGVYTRTDINGRTSNSVRIARSDGVARVIAEAMLIQSTDAGKLAITSRDDIPDFSVPLGQGFYTIRIGIGEVPTLTTNQDGAGDGLDVACDTLRLLTGTDDSPVAPGSDPAATQDLIDTCEELENQIADSEDPGADLDRIAPEELFAISDSLVSTADLQITNVYSRINAIRSGSTDRLDLSGLQFTLLGENIPGSVVNAAQNSLYGLSGGGASADDFFSERLGIFATGSISVGEIDGGLDDGTGRQQNADIETSGITIGADYRFSDSLVLGSGLNYAKNETLFTTAEGGSTVESFSLTLFGTWYKADLGYLDVVLNVGQSSFDIDRQINLISNDDNTVLAMGETDALVTSLTVGAGRNFNFGGWEFGPYGRLSLTRADVDGYSERASQTTEGFGSVLNIRSHSATSTTVSFGGQVSKAINTSKAVIIPQLRFEYEAETDESKDGISASFQADPSNSLFTIAGNERDTSYYNLGLGASAQFSKGRSAQLFYETRAQQDNVAQHWLKFGFRLQF